MIWATVCSWSCFCWLYRASPSLAAKNIINLISVLTIWWCPCVESSLVLLEDGVCYDQCVLLAKTLLAFALLHSIFQGQICLLLQVFLDFQLLHSSPLYWKGHLFWVLVLKGLVSLMLLLLLLSHFSRVWLCATSSTAAHQAPPSLGFSRQAHWSGLPFPSPMHESEKWKWSRSAMSDS